MLDEQFIKDFALIGFLTIAIIILLKILYEVRKQSRTIKDLTFQLKAYDVKDDTKEEERG